MKRLVIVIILFITLASVAFAQTDDVPLDDSVNINRITDLTNKYDGLDLNPRFRNLTYDNWFVENEFVDWYTWQHLYDFDKQEVVRSFLSQFNSYPHINETRVYNEIFDDPIFESLNLMKPEKYYFLFPESFMSDFVIIDLMVVDAIDEFYSNQDNRDYVIFSLEFDDYFFSFLSHAYENGLYQQFYDDEESND
jgi:hypothetical protein